MPVHLRPTVDLAADLDDAPPPPAPSALARATEVAPSDDADGAGDPDEASEPGMGCADVSAPSTRARPGKSSLRRLSDDDDCAELWRMPPRPCTDEEARQRLLLLPPAPLPRRVFPFGSRLSHRLSCCAFLLRLPTPRYVYSLWRRSDASARRLRCLPSTATLATTLPFSRPAPRPPPPLPQDDSLHCLSRQPALSRFSGAARGCCVLAACLLHCTASVVISLRVDSSNSFHTPPYHPLTLIPHGKGGGLH